MVTARASPLLLSHWTWLSSLPLPISFSTSKVLALTPIYLSSLLINKLITPALSISPIPWISCISCDLAYLAFEKTPAADLPLPSSLSWLLNIYRCINPTLNIWCLSLVKLPTTTCKLLLTHKCILNVRDQTLHLRIPYLQRALDFYDADWFSI